MGRVIVKTCVMSRAICTLIGARETMKGTYYRGNMPRGMSGKQN